MTISEYLKNDNNYLAHKDGISKNKETIEEHSSLVLKYARKIIEIQNLAPIITKLGEKFFKTDSENFKLWNQMFFDTIYLHDIGKSNTDFQSIKMCNKLFKSSPNRNSEHSCVSASLYFSKYCEQIKSSEEKDILFLFLLINSFVITKHHGYLNNFSDFLDNFTDQNSFLEIYKNLLPDISINFSILEKEIFINKLKKISYKTLDSIENNEKLKTIDLYIYTKLLYSLLVSADFYATAEYMNGFTPETNADFGVITDINKFFHPFKQTDTYKSIKAYENNRKEKDFADINEARSELFLEAEENLLQNSDKNLFYLEAPTGSGKTNTAINLSLQLVNNNKNINKIFYVFPFNTLVEQTKSTLLKSFGNNVSVGNEIGIINSVTPIYEENERDGNISNTQINYNSILMGRQFLHYPIIVTTHVKLFDWLFGVSRESHFPLCQLANSVIILDEIQSYKNAIWKEIAIFLQKYSELLNIKIIIMSATLPKIGYLIPYSNGFTDSIFQNLIHNREKYFNSPFFKNRVVPHFELIENFTHLEEDEKINILEEKIFEQFKNGKDVLVEFITKKRSLAFFKDFKERYENKINKNSIMLINGDDNLYTRNKIITEVKNPKRDYNVVLFSTQVIEAGVDIDFDIGFKDISILDSEEQFMGRINRSCKKKGEVWFFKLDDMSKIYKNDKRNELTLEKTDIQEKLKNKDFDNFYELILKKLEDESTRNTDNNFEKFRTNDIQCLNLKKIQERLTLLKDENAYTIFLNQNLETENGIIIGADIWKKYKDLLSDFEIPYSEKQIKLSQINKTFSYFTYTVRKINQNYNDIIGDIYYFEDGKRFLTEDGKFDRKEFEQNKEKINYEFI